MAPGLEAFVMCICTLKARDEEALRQALRFTASTLDEREAVKVVDTLNRNINANDRRFLHRLA
jgi:hypothetical protein